MARSRAPLALLSLVLVLVAALCGWQRWLHNARLGATPVPEDGTWWTADPDSLYHVRRVFRLMQEGFPVAQTDAYLNYPHGSAIPWPPDYTYVLWALVAPGAPRETEARRLHVEQGVATAPAFFAVLAALAIALAAWRSTRSPLAALAAGSYFAFYNGSIQYSAVAVGDHHAFVSCLLAWILFLMAEALAREHEHDARGAIRRGVPTGLLFGLMLGSWVGGLMYVVVADVVLGLALVAHARRPREALCPFGLTLHLSALAAVLPAAATSPWNETDPWMVVNLTWFHALFLALGAAVFVPPLLARRPARWTRLYPAIVAALLAVLIGGLMALDAGPGHGLREAFSWASRTNEFMSTITESQPLLGPKGSFGDLVKYLGLGALALPVAWLWAARRAWRAREGRWLPWLVGAPILLQQALVQRRFADALGPALAVLLGTAGGALLVALGQRLERVPGTVRALAAGILAVLAGAALNPFIARNTIGLVRSGQHWARGPGAYAQRGLRQQMEWLRAWPQARAGAVMATWGHGHLIEWAADRPTVGTNFGSYVGRDAYLDPWRFSLEEDPAAAEALLERRHARYVLTTYLDSREIATSVHLLRPGAEHEFYGQGPSGPLCGPRWYRTMAGRLAFWGQPVEPDTLAPRGPSLDFLRVVHVTRQLVPKVDVPPGPGPFPVGVLWERVPGARLEIPCEPGRTATVEIALAVDFPEGGLEFGWSGRATAGADGVARLRVPYATDAPNGIVQPVGTARWQAGKRSGRVAIPSAAVLAGASLRVE